MNVAIMQPYFLPYLGYFQLIASVERFVLYDDAQFIKNGWIERNRYLLDGQARWFGVPLERGHHNDRIHERKVSSSFTKEDILNKISFAYRKAPNRVFVLDLLDEILTCTGPDVALFNGRTLQRLCGYLEIKTRFSWSSDLELKDDCRGVARVIAMVKALDGTSYTNPIGGAHLYCKDAFSEQGLELRFLSPKLTEYAQYGGGFTPALSIIDLLMFNSREQVSVWAKHPIAELA